jgi:hypothetical protein
MIHCMYWIRCVSRTDGRYYSDEIREVDPGTPTFSGILCREENRQYRSHSLSGSWYYSHSYPGWAYSG